MWGVRQCTTLPAISAAQPVAHSLTFPTRERLLRPSALLTPRPAQVRIAKGSAKGRVGVVTQTANGFVYVVLHGAEHSKRYLPNDLCHM